MVKDPSGIEYKNIEEMCRHYHIDKTTFYRSLHKGMSCEEILNKPRRKYRKGPCVDHLGNTYANVKAMCDAYNIGPDTFQYRIDKGISLKEALTKPHKRRTGKVKDHLGNEYPSEKAMYTSYGLNKRTFKSRISESGMSLEKALTMPKNSYVVKDHLGNEYPSKTAMCNAYGISDTTFANRQKKGMTLEEILTTKVPNQISERHNERVTDPFGKEFKSITEMCRFYHVKYDTFSKYFRSGHTKEEALGIIPLFSRYSKGVTMNDHMKICFCIYDEKSRKSYFVCNIDEKEELMFRDEIVSFCIDTIRNQRQDKEAL